VYTLGTLMIKGQTYPDKHPAALIVLFLTEMWERFSFYGMRSLLVLYIVTQLNWGNGEAYMILGAYATLLYLGGIWGGALADRLLGFRQAIIIGGITITCGHFVLAIPGVMPLYLGLGLVLTGTGLFKANITSFLGDFYLPGDPRRDSAYTIFYMGINVGSLFAFIACGYVATRYGWHSAFSLAGFGMLFGLLIFIFGGKYLEDKGRPPCEDTIKKTHLGISYRVWVALGVLAIAALSSFLIHSNEILSYALPVIGVAVLGYWTYLALTHTKEVRQNIFSLMVLMFFMLCFLACWEQQATSLTILSEYHVDRAPSYLAGFLNWVGLEAVPTPWFAMCNAIAVILFGGVLAGAWSWLARHNKEPYDPMKFVIAFLFLSAAYVLLACKTAVVPEGGKLELFWIPLFYAIYTLGELCMMPVGFALVTKLAPKEQRGFFMGAWFMGLAFAQYLAALIAKMTATDDLVGEAAPLSVYADFFTEIAWVTFAAAALLFVLTFFMRPVFHRAEEEKAAA